MSNSSLPGNCPYRRCPRYTSKNLRRWDLPNCAIVSHGCLIHMFADLKAAGVVARRCIFAERGALSNARSHGRNKTPDVESVDIQVGSRLCGRRSRAWAGARLAAPAPNPPTFSPNSSKIYPKSNTEANSSDFCDSLISEDPMVLHGFDVVVGPEIDEKTIQNATLE